MRQHLQKSVTTKFYDPLYDVVIFEDWDQGQGEGVRASCWVQSQGGSENKAITASQLAGIIDSYEFVRLNFLHQAALTWLVFPSATHTRFSHALGCWVLASWASDHVLVDCPSQANHGERETKRLFNRLNDTGLIEEFQLALLLHDIGRSPVSHILENNDELLARYEDQFDRELDQTTIARQLITGEGPYAGLFRKHVERQCTAEEPPDQRRFLSRILDELNEGASETSSDGNLEDKIKLDVICYFLDPNEDKLPTSLNPEQARLAQALRELVSGVINLNRLDHYHRDAHFISTGVADFNVHGLLHNLVLVEHDDGDLDEPKVQLVEDGPESAFQMLHSRVSIVNRVFHNENALAYEAMWNYALNLHWEAPSEADDDDEYDWREYLPFLDDSDLWQLLLKSPEPRARRVAVRMRQRDPFVCAGRFEIPPKVYDKLQASPAERRLLLRHAFRRMAEGGGLGEEDCLLYCSRGFGSDGLRESLWMDPQRVLSDVPSKKRSGPTSFKRLAEFDDRHQFVKFVKEAISRENRTYWIFLMFGKRELAEAENRESLRAAKRVGDGMVKLFTNKELDRLASQDADPPVQ